MTPLRLVCSEQNLGQFLELVFCRNRPASVAVAAHHLAMTPEFRSKYRGKRLRLVITACDQPRQVDLNVRVPVRAHTLACCSRSFSDQHERDGMSLGEFRRPMKERSKQRCNGRCRTTGQPSRSFTSAWWRFTRCTTRPCTCNGGWQQQRQLGVQRGTRPDARTVLRSAECQYDMAKYTLPYDGMVKMYHRDSVDLAISIRVLNYAASQSVVVQDQTAPDAQVECPVWYVLSRSR